MAFLPAAPLPVASPLRSATCSRPTTPIASRRPAVPAAAAVAAAAVAAALIAGQAATAIGLPSLPSVPQMSLPSLPSVPQISLPKLMDSSGEEKTMQTARDAPNQLSEEDAGKADDLLSRLEAKKKARASAGN